MTTETAAIIMPDTYGSASSAGFHITVSGPATVIRDFIAGLNDATASSSRIDELVEAQFNELASRWHDETELLSNPAYIRSDPNYQRIIMLGKPAIPFILRDLRQRGGDWYAALEVLTGATPVTRDAWGKTRLMKEQWFDWAKKHGYEF